MTAQIIKNSHVTVKPFKYDVDYSIVPFLTSCPFSKGAVMPQDLSVTVFKGIKPFSDLEVNQNSVFSARIIGAQTWFSQLSKKTNVVIKLESRELIDRNFELSKLNTDVASIYVPHLTIAYDIPAPVADMRWWLNDILNKFNQGAEGKYYGNTIRLAYESISDTVITDEDSNIPIVTKPI